MGHHYAWALPEVLWEMPSDLLFVYYQRIAESEKRRAWPIMVLTSFIGNALGGKSDAISTTPKSKLWSPLDFLPYFAHTKTSLLELKFGGSAFSPEQCNWISEGVANRELPSWVVQIIDRIQPIEKIVKGTRGEK